jgi:hydrogenase maturation factor
VSELPLVNGVGNGLYCDIGDDGCITCGDVAVPVRITELLGDGLAMVDTGVSSEEISIALVTADIGDVVLVHAKEAIAVVTELAQS